MIVIWAMIKMVGSSHLQFILANPMIMTARPKHPGPVLGVSLLAN